MSDLDAEISAVEKRMGELNGERKRIDEEYALLSHKLWLLDNDRKKSYQRAAWELRPAPVWASEPPPGEWRIADVYSGSVWLSPGPGTFSFKIYSRRTGYALRKRSGPRLDVEATLAAWKAWRPHG